QWLLLLRDSLIHERDNRLILLAGLPAAWLERDGELEVTNAPTHYGVANLRAGWQAGSGTLRLDLNMHTPPSYGYYLFLPCPVAAISVDGSSLGDTLISDSKRIFQLPPTAEA